MKKIGLALGGGGSRGLAHIGVIKCLEDNNIPIDYIAGTSAGALIGGFYSAWHNIARIEELVNNVNYQKMIEILFDPLTVTGLIKGEKLTKFLQKNLGNLDIEKLSIPFCAVASDIISGKSHIFRSGDLVSAIRTSCSIPIVFSPIKTGSEILVDGGASMPVPVSAVKNMGADMVIAVNVYSGLFPNESSNMFTSMYLMLYHLAQANSSLADVIIKPHIPNVNPIDFVKAKNLIDLGYEATLKQIPEIKKFNSFWYIFRPKTKKNQK